jgi:photosystem II stability/assembly factor-like uncharacterized protein
MRKVALVAAVVLMLLLAAGCTSSALLTKTKTVAAESTVLTTIPPVGGDRTTKTLPSATVAPKSQAADPRITPTAVAGAAGYLWMLGTYPCSTRTCQVLMGSADSGKSWVRVGTPPAGMFGLEFANRQDGYAYGRDQQGNASRLYWTDDAGRSWRLVFTRFRTTRRLPVTATEAENPFGWAAFGSNVWILLTSVSKAQLLLSHDGGRTFSKLTPGGYLGAIGCTLSATSLTTLWGFCVTGNGGYGIRSTDGGKKFVTVLTPGGLSNAVEIYPVSDHEAIFYSGDLWLTGDGGGHFSALLRVPQEYRCEVALANATEWFVFGVSGYGPLNLMWSTSNGGRTWQSVNTSAVGG